MHKYDGNRFGVVTASTARFHYVAAIPRSSGGFYNEYILSEQFQRSPYLANHRQTNFYMSRRRTDSGAVNKPIK